MTGHAHRPMDGELGRRLESVLDASRSRGLLGKGEISQHIANARGFAEFLAPGDRVLDLGSGGGVPGLPLTLMVRDVRMTLLDSARRRIRFLGWALDQLSAVDPTLEARTSLLWGRAEDQARLPGNEGAFDAVVARSFGRPAVVAECSRRFLRDGGVLVVSEPPIEDASRWPEPALERMDWLVEGRRDGPSGSFMLLRAAGDCPDGIPRRAGVPERRPAF